MKYETERQKAAKYLKNIIHLKSDGEQYNLKQFFARVYTETGFKKDIIDELVKSFEDLGEVIINEKKNTIQFNSKKISKEEDKEIQDVIG